MYNETRQVTQAASFGIAGRCREDEPKRASMPELPAAIEACQKSAALLNEQVAALIGQLSPITNPSPAVDEDHCKMPLRNGILQPLEELKAAIESATEGIRSLRNNLMI